MKVLFSPKYKKIHAFDNSYFQNEDIRQEPMIFSGDLEFSFNHGGPIMRAVLRAIENSGELKLIGNKNVVIDTRVNMLMKGQYPSMPGWHCDDVPRVDRNSQPDISKIGNSDTRHYIFLATDRGEENISGTEFISGDREIEIDPENVWKTLDKKLRENSGKTFRVKPNEILRFNIDAAHRATPATYNGWRFFLRLSVTHRKPVNEIRNQVQVYVPVDDYGW